MKLKVDQVWHLVKTYHIEVPDTFRLGRDDIGPYLYKIDQQLKFESDHASPLFYTEDWENIDTLVEAE